MHDKAPGMPVSVVNSTHNAPSRPSINTKLVVSNLHYNITPKDLIVSCIDVFSLFVHPLKLNLAVNLRPNWHACARASNQSTDHLSAHSASESP